MCLGGDICELDICALGICSVVNRDGTGCCIGRSSYIADGIIVASGTVVCINLASMNSLGSNESNDMVGVSASRRPVHGCVVFRPDACLFMTEAGSMRVSTKSETGALQNLQSLSTGRQHSNSGSNLN